MKIETGGEPRVRYWRKVNYPNVMARYWGSTTVYTDSADSAYLQARSYLIWL